MHSTFSSGSSPPSKLAAALSGGPAQWAGGASPRDASWAVGIKSAVPAHPAGLRGASAEAMSSGSAEEPLRRARGKRAVAGDPGGALGRPGVFVFQNEIQRERASAGGSPLEEEGGI